MTTPLSYLCYVCMRVYPPVEAARRPLPLSSEVCTSLPMHEANADFWIATRPPATNARVQIRRMYGLCNTHRFEEALFCTAELLLASPAENHLLVRYAEVELVTAISALLLFWDETSPSSCRHRYVSFCVNLFADLLQFGRFRVCQTILRTRSCKYQQTCCWNE